MNEPERETVKETIKDLMTLTKDCTYLDDKDGAVEMEKRLTEITHKLIDML